jgi:hypothetical protein
VIKDFLLDEQGTQPEWSALFAVNMLVNTEGGNCYKLADIQCWFNQADLELESVLTITPRSRLVQARRRLGR